MDRILEASKNRNGTCPNSQQSSSHLLRSKGLSWVSHDWQETSFTHGAGPNSLTQEANCDLPEWLQQHFNGKSDRNRITDMCWLVTGTKVPTFFVFLILGRGSRFFFCKKSYSLLLYADRITKIWEPSEIPELRLTWPAVVHRVEDAQHSFDISGFIYYMIPWS